MLLVISYYDDKLGLNVGIKNNIVQVAVKRRSASNLLLYYKK